MPGGDIHMDATQTRVALLIDADNINSTHAEAMLRAAAAHGNVVVRKGYGSIISGGFPWKREAMFKYAIEPVARYPYARGKNVSDIALVMDAMNLMHRKSVEVICLASSDSDFSLLAMKLRENGVKVHGFGEPKTLPAFVASCDSFMYLPAIAKAEKPADSGETGGTKQAPPPQVVKILTDAYDSCDNDSGWVLLTQVMGYLKRVNPAFSPKDYGHGKIGALMKSTGLFNVDADKVQKNG